jgi:hypothetical protein
LQSGNLQLVIENLRFHLFSIIRLPDYQSPPLDAIESAEFSAL